MNTKYFLAGVITTILVFAVAVGSYFIGKGTVPKGIDNQGIDTLSLPTQAILPTNIPTITQIDSITKIIETAIKQNTYNVLEDHMLKNVFVRIEATECCGELTKEATIDQLAYLDSAKGTWNFEKDNPIAANLAASFPEYYANAIIGISSDNLVVAFQINNSDKIEKISMAADYKLLIP